MQAHGGPPFGYFLLVRRLTEKLRGGRVCDPYGVALGLATLPGGDQTDVHDTLGAELLDIMHEAGYRAELEPRGLFTSLIPVAVLHGLCSWRTVRRLGWFRMPPWMWPSRL